MLTLQETLNESYPAEAASISRARTEVVKLAARAGVTGEPLHTVRLVVSEAVTNAVRHAYRTERAGAIHLTATTTGTQLWVLVADDGCGYRTPAANPGLGWGLTLIANLSDEYVITERATGGTEVRLHFPLTGGGEPSPPSSTVAVVEDVAEHPPPSTGGT